MKQLLLRLAENLDQAFLATRLRLFGEKSGIRGLLFHTVFLNSSELEKEEALPQQRLTISNYEEIFEYFLSNGYQFLAYSDLQNTIEDKKNYVYVTFDDGYFTTIPNTVILGQVYIRYTLFSGSDSLIANKLLSLGLPVSVESVQWFRRLLLKSKGLETETFNFYLKASRKFREDEDRKQKMLGLKRYSGLE